MEKVTDGDIARIRDDIYQCNTWRIADIADAVNLSSQPTLMPGVMVAITICCIGHHAA